MSDLEYPEARAGLFYLIDATVHAGVTVTAFYELTIDYKELAPAVLIYTTGGVEGYIDRVDDCTVEVYAPGTQAVAVAESVRRALTHPDGVEVPDVGYFDSIEVAVTPHDVPWVDESTNLARMTFRVTARPI